MTLRFIGILSALMGCCILAACSTPGAAPQSAVSSGGPSQAQSAENPAESGGNSQSEGEEQNVSEPLFVADAARYRGTVSSIDTMLDGSTLYKLESFPGSGLPEMLMISFSEDTEASFDLATVKEEDHLEVFYGAPPEGGESCGLTCYDAVAVNRLLPAQAVYYSGYLVKTEEREDGSLDLVMAPQGLEPAEREEPGNQFIFHTGEETQFYLPEEELLPGARLLVYHRGFATLSIPPQGGALEVSLYREPGNG